MSGLVDIEDPGVINFRTDAGPLLRVATLGCHEVHNGDRPQGVHDASGVGPNLPGKLAQDARDLLVLLVTQTNNGVVELHEDSTYVGDLSLSTATVTAMTFRDITTSSSQGVKVELTFESIDPSQGTSTTFYTTGILRGSYSN